MLLILLKKANKFLQSLKLEFSKPEMEKNYKALKEQNMVKDFKVCLLFLVFVNLVTVTMNAIHSLWREFLVAGVTVAILLLVYCLQRFFTQYIQFITLILILSYNMTRFLILESYFKGPSKSLLFLSGYSLASLQIILLFYLLKVSQKTIGIIAALIIRFLLVFVYITHEPFNVLLFIRQLIVDAFIIYTFYNHEVVFRKIYLDFIQKKEELLQFKELLAESLPQSLLIVTYKSNDILFSNEAFKNAFCTIKGIRFSKLDLRSLVVDHSTIRDATTNNIASVFVNDAKNSLSLAKVLKTLSSEGYLHEKTISLAASLTHEIDRKLFEITLKKIKWDSEDAIAIIFNDITYQESLISLKLANLNKDKVIATISHELRTPLNGIIGILDITEKQVEDKQIAEYLSLCKDNAHLLLSLVNSILDLQQISAGKLKLNLVDVDIRKVVNSISQLFYFQCKNKNISLDYEINKDVPMYISTDENRLKQILINLIGNAIKFTLRGSVKIKIVPHCNIPNNLHISVRDTGIGIKQEHQKNLFKMYGKIEDGESVNKHGVGLGLTISNALAVVLSGDQEGQGIKLQSQYGVGSRFYFRIQTILKEKRINQHRKDDSTIEGNVKMNKSIFPGNTTRDLFVNKENTSEKQRLEVEEDGQAESNYEDDFREFLEVSDHEPKLSPYNSPKRVTINSSTLLRYNNDLTPFKRISTQNDDQKNSRQGSSSMQKQKSTIVFDKFDFDILLVDDNPFNLLVAKRLIEELGCNVQTALGGKEAIEIVKQNSSVGVTFKVIFMDCQMPMMDGFETTLNLIDLMKFGEIPESPIFGWTANNSDEDVNRCFEAGMVGHLPKPASKSDFLRVISSL